MSVRFRILTEDDVKAVLTMDDLIETMASALKRFSSGGVVQPVRSVVTVDQHAFFGVMPAYVRSAKPSGERRDASLGAKLVTVFESNTERGMPTHLASIALLDPQTGALRALLDGRYITESRTAAVSAVTSRLLARKHAASLAIIGSGVQARSHLEALSRVHRLRHVTVWSPNKERRDAFVQHARDALKRDALKGVPYNVSLPYNESAVGDGLQAVPRDAPAAPPVNAVDHAGEAIVGADLIVLATSSPTPVIENNWVKPGAHVMSVGACRPNQREMDPELMERGRLFVDSRAAALVESGDVVMGIHEGRFTAEHIIAEIGELVAAGTGADGGTAGRRTDKDVTIFKSLGLAVEDVTAADLAYRRAVERGIGQVLTL
jgi:ornithine cyclodeaminase/alanine dehydrogenase-like protein (mu-crystallin family)